MILLELKELLNYIHKLKLAFYNYLLMKAQNKLVLKLIYVKKKY